MRRLETARGTFAVKQAFDDSACSATGGSTAYHRACWEAGVPTPELIRAATGGFLREPLLLPDVDALLDAVG